MPLSRHKMYNDVTSLNFINIVNQIRRTELNNIAIDIIFFFTFSGYLDRPCVAMFLMFCEQFPVTSLLVNGYKHIEMA